MNNIKRTDKNTAANKNALGLRIFLSLIIAAAVLCVRYAENPYTNSFKKQIYYVVKSDFKADDCKKIFNLITNKAK